VNKKKKKKMKKRKKKKKKKKKKKMNWKKCFTLWKTFFNIETDVSDARLFFLLKT